MKYYAVRVGKEPGIYTDWSEVQPLVSGFKGAIYKSFNTLEEAEEFMGEVSSENPKEATITNESLIDIDVLEDARKGIAHVFVDGSHISEKGKRKNLQPTYGVILLQNNPIRDKTNELIATMITGSVKEFKNVKDVTISNQIAGELYSALRAVKLAIQMRMKEVYVYYDYAGIEQWALGNWDAKNELSQSYKEQMSELMEYIKVHFVKTKGHNDVLYNEVVDMVAKAGKWLD